MQRQERYGTAAQWTTANTVLLIAEIGIESDTGKGKIGDGTTAWSVLPYSFVRNIDTSFALKADVISETITDYTLASNVLTMDLAVSNVAFIATAPTAAMTFNFTNAPTTNYKSITASIFVTQGATGYIPTTLQIAGAAQTIKWAGGTAPTATSTAGKIDVFSFSMIRRGSAWTVLGSALANF